MGRLAALVVLALVGCATAAEDVEAIPGRGDSSSPPTDSSAVDETGSPVPDTATGEAPADSGAPTDSKPIFETEPDCDAGASLCAFMCVDLKTDTKNCGMCGKTCAAGETCNAGTCEIACAAPTTKCGTACVNTASDTSNCGSCGKICAAGQTCNAGTCEIVCGAPTTKCGTACVNTASDTSNCGSCGKICAAGETCNTGTCTPPIVRTNVTFPSTTSSVGTSGGTGALGAGGGGKYYVSGDYVTETFARASSATKLTVNFRMSDWTTNYCSVGTLSWSVMVNGSVVGSFSWLGGTTPWSPGPPGPDKTIFQTYSFAAIAPVSGTFTLRFQATSTVCLYGGSWNYYPGGTASLE